MGTRTAHTKYSVSQRASLVIRCVLEIRRLDGRVNRASASGPVHSYIIHVKDSLIELQCRFEDLSPDHFKTTALLLRLC